MIETVPQLPHTQTNVGQQYNTCHFKYHANIPRKTHQCRNLMREQKTSCIPKQHPLFLNLCNTFRGEPNTCSKHKWAHVSMSQLSLFKPQNLFTLSLIHNNSYSRDNGCRLIKTMYNTCKVNSFQIKALSEKYCTLRKNAPLCALKSLPWIFHKLDT